MINELDFKKAKKGDSESFYKLINPIQSKLYKIAFVYMKNEDDALDAIQDTIMKAVKALNNLKEPQYFNSWITKILINTCKTNYKKRVTTNLNIDDFSDSLGYDAIDYNDNSELYEALKTLKENDREIIIMRYMEDMALKDISRQKDMPLGTVKSIVSRSLKKLRISLKGAN